MLGIGIRRGSSMGRVLVLAAHPDDETIGASWLLASCPDAVVVHATDGAPRDPRLWSTPGVTWESYAARRVEERRRALAIAGVSADRQIALELLDQELVRALVPFARALAKIFAARAPAWVVTHPYEGGHPDHDACAFAAAAAIALTRADARPLLVEMASYHRFEGRLRTGELLEAQGLPITTLTLTEPERARKRLMLACYESQAGVLADFGVDVERHRRAPRYDFTRPPHAGARHYETLGWPIDAERWCALATEAARELDALSAGRAREEEVACR
jgi:LmbE family N-acetylglucosaminyl deacetylase